MLKIFLLIAKKPSSFKEVVEETGYSKSTVFTHLEFLEKKARAIERDIIKAYQTTNEKDIGKIFYRVSIDEIPHMVEEALSLLSILSEPFGDKELDRQLLEHKKAIADLLNLYLTQLNRNRNLALNLEKDTLHREVRKKTPRKKRES